MAFRAALRVACVMFLLASLSGCVVARSVGDWFGHVGQVLQQKELAAEQKRLAKRDYLAARVQLHKEHRQQLEFDRLQAQVDRQAEQERREEALREQRRERVRTDIGLKLDHNVRLGQLQVDVTKLEKILEQRKQQQEALNEALTELNQERIRRNKEIYLRRATEALSRNDVRAAEQAMDECARVCNCAAPPQEALEGGPNEEAIEQPLLPTEIPLMLPVTLALEQNAPVIQGARVVSQPPPEEALEAEECVEEACCEKKHKVGKARVFMPQALRNMFGDPPVPPAEGP
jgi:hypothetical protein